MGRLPARLMESHLVLGNQGMFVRTCEITTLSGSSEQRNQPVAMPEQENLGEFEKRLLLAKSKSKANMPDIFQIP